MTFIGLLPLVLLWIMSTLCGAETNPATDSARYPLAYLGVYLSNDTEVYLDLPDQVDAPPSSVHEFVKKANRDFQEGSRYYFASVSDLDTKLGNFVNDAFKGEDTFYAYDNKGPLGIFRFKDVMYAFNGATGEDFWYLRLTPVKLQREWNSDTDRRRPVILPSSTALNQLRVTFDTSYRKSMDEYLTEPEPGVQDEMWGEIYTEYRLKSHRPQIEIRVIEKWNNPDQPPAELRIFRNKRQIYFTLGDHLGC